MALVFYAILTVFFFGNSCLAVGGIFGSGYGDDVFISEDTSSTAEGDLLPITSEPPKMESQKTTVKLQPIVKNEIDPSPAPLIGERETIAEAVPSPESIVKDEQLLLLRKPWPIGGNGLTDLITKSDNDEEMSDNTTVSSSTPAVLISTSTSVQHVTLSNATQDDIGIVTSLGLDKDAAISPMPPVMARENVSVDLILPPGPSNGTDKEKFNETLAPTTPREPPAKTTRVTTNATTTMATTTKTNGTTASILVPVTTRTVSTSTIKLLNTTKQAATALHTTNSTVRHDLTTPFIEIRNVTSSFWATPTPPRQNQTTTHFLAFLDPEFEKKYIPSSLRKITAEPVIDERQTGEPIQCFICTNSSGSCDVSVPLDERHKGVNLLNYDTPTIGVSLIRCPVYARSCAKQTVTVRYLFHSEVKYETTVTRFCSNVYEDHCDKRAGSSSTYEQCYCRSDACNSAPRVTRYTSEIIATFFSTILLQWR